MGRTLTHLAQALTRENVERKLTRTAEELMAEEGEDEDPLMDAAAAAAAEDDEADAMVDENEGGLAPGALYNPKGLPLGWDGKVRGALGGEAGPRAVGG